MQIIWLLFVLFVFLYAAVSLETLFKNKQALATLLLAFTSIFVAVSMVLYPQEAFQASLDGLSIWWNIVFPALLPFFVMAQILIGLGAVNMMGVFLEPVMRPVFNVPGEGSFVLAMGLASGFPLGAIITADMRRKEILNKVEAERLVSFVNTADPLFMFGAVAVGMIGLPEVGIIIALAHYLSTLSIGFLMRFYKAKSSPLDAAVSVYDKNHGLLKRAVTALLEARKKDGRPFGQLMGDAINKSIQTLLLIGGFIILFSVIIRILHIAGAVEVFAHLVSIIIVPLGLDIDLAPSLFSGLLEIDLGCQHIASAGAPLQDILIITGVIIAWSGLSVHAQVASIVSDTDISVLPYICARGLHAILAGLYTFFILEFFPSATESITLPAFLHHTPAATDLSFWWSRTAFMVPRVLCFLLFLLIISFIIYCAKKWYSRHM